MTLHASPSRTRRIAAFATLLTLFSACTSDKQAASNATVSSPSSVSPETAASTVADATSTTVAPSTTVATQANNSSYDLFPNGLRNVRYCEIALLKKPTTEYVLEVWNTIGYSDCPQADWDAIDAAKTAADNGAIVTLKNGPRYWTLDEIRTDIRKTAVTTTFGNIKMFLGTTLKFGPSLPSQTPYTIRLVPRETLFVYKAGSAVFELHDDAGHTYVMQSYALTKSPALTIDGLAALGSSLKVPPGWSFSTRTLDADLLLPSTDGIATVVQDDFDNTYQRIDS